MLSAALLAAPFLEPRLFPLAWLSFVPLFWAIQRAGTFRKGVFCGWFMGFVAHLIGFHWLVYTISAFGGFPYSISAIVFLLYAALQAIQMALFALLVRSVGLGPLCIFPAVFWVALEFLFPLLFPWHVANSQVSFLWFIQSADLVGPYGASFIVVWFNAALFRALACSRTGTLGSFSRARLFGFCDRVVACLWIPENRKRRRGHGNGAQIACGRGAGQRGYRS